MFICIRCPSTNIFVHNMCLSIKRSLSITDVCALKMFDHTRCLYVIGVYLYHNIQMFTHAIVDVSQESMRGQRGTLRALAVICHSH